MRLTCGPPSCLWQHSVTDTDTSLQVDKVCNKVLEQTTVFPLLLLRSERGAAKAAEAETIMDFLLVARLGLKDWLHKEILKVRT